MTDICRGDIVSISRRPGLWVAMLQRRDIGPSFFDFRRVRTTEGLQISALSTSLVARPTFYPGMIVRHHGDDASVIGETAAGDIKIAYSSRTPITPDGKACAQIDWLVVEDRGELVHANHHLFL